MKAIDKLPLLLLCKAEKSGEDDVDGEPETFI